MNPDATSYLDSLTLQEFVQAASAEPLRGEEEEAALAEAVRRGDEGAADRLVRIHLRDAVDEAIRNRGDVKVRVLIRHGVRGLVEAARRYDPARDGSFGRFARGAVRRAVQAASLPES